MKKDYAVGFLLIYAAFIGKLTPIMEVVATIDGHPFHKLVKIGMERMAACSEQLDVLAVAQEVMASA